MFYLKAFWDKAAETKGSIPAPTIHSQLGLSNNLASFEKGIFGICNHLSKLESCKRNLTSLNPFVIAFCGHILNRQELAKKLNLLSQTSDCQLLFYAFEKWGNCCLEHIEGDFAFAIWDCEKRELFLVRDRLGTFPIYFARNESFVEIASHAHLIGGSRGQMPRLSKKALAMWALNGYSEEIPLYCGVEGLAAAHFIELNQKHVLKKRYWKSWEAPSIRYSQIEQYAEHLEDLIGRCVGQRLGQESAGLLLSSGMDSAAVATFAIAQDSDMVAFTFRFQTLTDCDEWLGAKRLTEKLSMHHQGVDAESNWLLKGVQNQAFKTDPFLSWDLLTRQLMQSLVLKGKRILLTGHGGDNMFTGISPALLASLPLPFASMSIWRHALGLWREANYATLHGLYRYVIRPKAYAMKRRLNPWPNRFPWIPISVCKTFFPDGLPWRERHRPELAPEVNAMVKMVDDYTIGVRRAIHWYRDLGEPLGVSVRHPLFDRRLAEFMVAIPPEICRLNHQPKGVLKHILAKKVGNTIVNQRTKPSLAGFYRQGIVKEQALIGDLMEKMVLEELGIVDSRQIKNAVRKYYASGAGPTLAWFFPTLCTEFWLRSALELGIKLE